MSINTATNRLQFFRLNHNTDPAAAALGMVGAFLLATNGDLAKWGWVLFILSNALWILSGIKVRNKSMIAQYLLFTATALYGIRNTFF